MFAERWNQLESQPELKSLISVENNGVMQPCIICDFNGVLVEKDISPKINAAYKERIQLMFDPLVSQSDAEVKNKLLQRGIKITSENGSSITKSLRDFVADECYQPKKGTPARKIVYDLAEPLFETGEIKVTLYGDVKPFLETASKKFKVKVLTRGTESLVTKICKGIGIYDLVGNPDSTISFGNTKTAETFIRYYFDELKNNRKIEFIVEDEFEAVQELILASCWITAATNASTPAFRVWWVDRDNEEKTFVDQLKQLKNELQQKGFELDNVLIRSNILSMESIAK